MTALVAMRVDDQTAAMVVPLTALTEVDGGAVAFVVDPEIKCVRRTPVTVAGTTSDGVQVAGGSQAGDMVVSAGVQFLRDGMRIRLPGERQQARSDKPI